MADVKPIADNYPQLVPYLCVDGADAAIGFYRTVFGAFKRMRMPEPDGRLGHAEVEIGSAVIMLGWSTESYRPVSTNPSGKKYLAEVSPGHQLGPRSPSWTRRMA